MEVREVAGSFRDPSGFLFEMNGNLFRQVNKTYQPHFDRLVDSGLYESLSNDRLLIPHRAADRSLAQSEDAHCVLQPERLPFVSYPHEWCFGQLKDAALLTLELQKRALEHGMVLKDASAYNVQFVGARPIFIDSLSFEIREKGQPWVAYRQFCQHFLAPLLLIAKVDERLTDLLLTNIDGVPLDLAAKLLPRTARFRPSVFTHIVMHAKAQRCFADSSRADSLKPKTRKISDLGMRGLVDNLESTVRAMEWNHPKSEWGDYYEDTNYDAEAMSEKERTIGSFLERAGRVPRIIDVGANTGRFSAIAKRFADCVVALDIDRVAVDKHYQQLRSTNDSDIIPLRVDLTAPTPSFGWGAQERMSIFERCTPSTVLALALIHHLAISNNVPLPRIASFFRAFADHLVIEFVPKSDSQVQRLLETRKDIFVDYTQAAFEAAFKEYFELQERQPLIDSDRTLYLFQAR